MPGSRFFSLFGWLESVLGRPAYHMFHQPVKKAGNEILLIPFAALAGMVGLCVILMGDADRRNAEQIILKIEDYRRQEGHLPDPENHSLMQTLGFELRIGWNPDYEPLDSANYRIALLRDLDGDGPCWFYESKSAVWCQDIPPVSASAAEQHKALRTPPASPSVVP